MADHDKNHEGDQREEQRHRITVYINGQTIEFESHAATGAEIKRAAFAQGRHLQPDYILMESLPNGASRMIANDEEVHLQDQMKFTVIAPAISIAVNDQPVDIHTHAATGLEIKVAAIEQSVHIRLDSILRENLPDGTDRLIGDHEEVHLHTGMKFTAIAQPVTITVNEQPVEFHIHKTTGAEIKSVAIAQGVLIQQNFVLQEELANGTSRVIGDSDEVHLRKHLRFTAIAPDDNS